MEYIHKCHFTLAELAYLHSLVLQRDQELDRLGDRARELCAVVDDRSPNINGKLTSYLNAAISASR